MSKTPKQILYILDYERYLKSGTKLPLANVMNGDESDWIETHKWQLDTAKKREKMMQFYAPSDDDDDTKRGPKKKLKKKTVKKRKQVRARRKRQITLDEKFQLSYDMSRKFFDDKWCQQIEQNYKSAGVSWQKVEDATGISKEIWQEKGVKS